MSEKVLLVDDEPEFLEIMSERMRARGIEVVTTTSASDAVDRIGAESYDAVILDFMMPEMDGLQAIQAIKEKKPHLQIILLTGHATLEKGIEAMKLGAMDVVEKPANLEDLTEKIKKAHDLKVTIVEKRDKDRVMEMLRKFGM